MHSAWLRFETPRNHETIVFGELPLGICKIDWIRFAECLDWKNPMNFATLLDLLPKGFGVMLAAPRFGEAVSYIPGLAG